MLDRTENLAALAENWLVQFEQALAQAGDSLLKALFHSESYWRDVLALTWDIRTVKGADEIVRGRAVSVAASRHAAAGLIALTAGRRSSSRRSPSTRSDS